MDKERQQLLQAAEKGDADAQFNLGVLYRNGLDDNHYAVEGNRPEAVRWRYGLGASFEFSGGGDEDRILGAEPSQASCVV